MYTVQLLDLLIHQMEVYVIPLWIYTPWHAILVGETSPSLCQTYSMIVVIDELWWQGIRSLCPCSPCWKGALDKHEYHTLWLELPKGSKLKTMTIHQIHVEFAKTTWHVLQLGKMMSRMEMKLKIEMGTNNVVMIISKNKHIL